MTLEQINQAEANGILTAAEAQAKRDQLSMDASNGEPTEAITILEEGDLTKVKGLDNLSYARARQARKGEGGAMLTPEQYAEIFDGQLFNSKSVPMLIVKTASQKKAPDLVGRNGFTAQKRLVVKTLDDKHTFAIDAGNIFLKGSDESRPTMKVPDNWNEQTKPGQQIQVGCAELRIQEVIDDPTRAAVYMGFIVE